jgi:hypothetical protein
MGLLFLSLLIVPVSFAQGPKETDRVRLTDHLSLGATVSYMFNGETSFEFGNPVPPYQAPLSRLEFPLDSWWGGMQLTLHYPRFSVAFEGLASASQEVHGTMKDSDWLDNSGARTLYSESRSRLSPCYMAKGEVELEISDWLRLPPWLILRPIGGVRYQKFNMVAHDGIMYDLVTGGPPVPFKGDAIRFKQTYWQYFLGVRSDIDLSRLVGVSSLVLLAQVDWAYVEGNNEDHHLQREVPDFFTFERTYGHAWHGSLGLRKGVWKNLFLGLEVDYLTIDTRGSHHWSVASLGADSTWTNGVRVWSEQTRASLTLEYRF